MNKKKLWLILLLIIASGIIISGIIIGFILRPQKAVLIIDTKPPSNVQINGVEIGTTPIEEELPAGEIVVKLIPQNPDTPLVPYETKVKLEAGVKTIVRRKLGETRESSSGEVISFDRVGAGVANITIITIPDNASVLLDNNLKDSAPTKFTNTPPGEHTVKVSANGYVESEFKVLAETNFTTTVIVELEKNANEEPPPPLPEVTIGDTPTGFLRVREEPSVESREVNQVKPGQTYKVLQTDKDTGWYKIMFGEEVTGWITNEYASASGETLPN